MAREAPPQPRRSARLRAVCEILLLDSDEHATYAEAMIDPDSEKWQSAMRSEIDSIGDNQVWNLVDPPTSIRLDLSQKGLDKFKELTTTRHSLP
jgi:hypothetical protein